MKVHRAVIFLFLTRAIGVKIPTVSGQDCLCLGPLQAIFVLAACVKPRTDTVGLIANKLDAVSLSKFAHRVQVINEVKSSGGLCT